MRKLGWPTLFCNALEVDARGRIAGYRLRSPTASARRSTRFTALNFRVVAAGDSYNDTAMLGEADAGILFRPPENVIARVPAVPGDPHLRRAPRRVSQGGARCGSGMSGPCETARSSRRSRSAARRPVALARGAESRGAGRDAARAARRTTSICCFIQRAEFGRRSLVRPNGFPGRPRIRPRSEREDTAIRETLRGVGIDLRTLARRSRRSTRSRASRADASCRWSSARSSSRSRSRSPARTTRCRVRSGCRFRT